MAESRPNDESVPVPELAMLRSKRTATVRQRSTPSEHTQLLLSPSLQLWVPVTLAPGQDKTGRSTPFRVRRDEKLVYLARSRTLQQVEDGPNQHGTTICSDHLRGYRPD